MGGRNPQVRPPRQSEDPSRPCDPGPAAVPAVSGQRVSRGVVRSTQSGGADMGGQTPQMRLPRLKARVDHVAWASSGTCREETTHSQRMPFTEFFQGKGACEFVATCVDQAAMWPLRLECIMWPYGQQEALVVAGSPTAGCCQLSYFGAWEVAAL